MGIKQYVAVILITVIASASITFNILQQRDIEQLEEGGRVTAREAETTISELRGIIEEQKVVIYNFEREVDDLEEEIEDLE